VKFFHGRDQMTGCPSPTHTYVSVRPAALTHSLFNRLIYKHQLCIFTFLICSMLSRAQETLPPEKWQYLR